MLDGGGGQARSPAGNRSFGAKSTVPVLRPAFLLFLLIAPPAAGQPFFFGSADAPDEAVAETWWQRQASVEVRGGVSLIGPQWRGAVGLDAAYARPHLSARLGGSVNAGPMGVYEKDFDEPYDALRLVRYVRYDPGREGRVYARVGPLQHVRLGTGHLVSFFSGQTAWDRRTAGAEVAFRLPHLALDAFAEDVRLRGLAGGYARLTPRLGKPGSLLRSVQLGGTYVRDLSAQRRHATAYGLDLSLDLIQTGDFDVRPYVSAARIHDYGEGLAVGLALENLNFLDAARLQARLALTYSGRRFLPGYFGALYTVQNPGARIVDSAGYLADEARQDTIGVGLASVRGGSGFITELRVLLFGRVQLWHQFYRHYGLQPLSSHHFRAYFQVPEQVEFGLGIDREGLRDFLSLFNQINDQSALVLTGRYRAFGPVVVGLDARYTFERLNRRAGQDRFLVQRRFEPYAAFRLLF